MYRLLVTVAAVLLAASQALAHGDESIPPPKKGPAPIPVNVIQTDKGDMLVDAKGMTLYYFDRDDSGNKSNCNGKCNERWVPLTASKDDQPIGDFTVITRDDGSKMWAYRYRPLYTSQTDKAPGEANGADTSTHWHIARPAY